MNGNATRTSQTARVLVGDIGGTHARLTVAEVGPATVTLGEPEVRGSSDYPSLEALIADFLGTCPDPPHYASLALAGPIREGRGHITNIGWSVDRTALEESLGFKRLQVLNDFAALAYAVPKLTPDEIETVKDGVAAPHMPISVMGAGTGFGVALLAPCGPRYSLIATEGGHAGFAPRDDLENRLWEHLHREAARVSIETVLSGAGLSRIYEALHAFNGETEHSDPQTICRRALEDRHSIAHQALQLFCAIFGAVAGDIALLHGASGGIYLAGGVLMKNRQSLAESRFVDRFKGKGVMSPFVENIPVHLIRSDYAGLKGAALWFADHHDA